MRDFDENIPVPYGRPPPSSLRKPTRDYCQTADCEAYIGHGTYARSYADVTFTNSRNERVRLCSRCFEKVADRSGTSTMALHLEDSESIPSEHHARETLSNTRREPDE